MHGMSEAAEPVRVDKWLWAARLVKTRALAVDAIKGGRVSINGQRVKPSREVQPGDRLEFSNGPVRTVVVVRDLSRRRGPASEAALLYDETAESLAAREAYVAQRRAAPPPQPGGGARPTKRDRRRFEATRGREED
jgi:ribosome-associated heat shock protein Hsp15